MSTFDLHARQSERKAYELLMGEVKARIFAIRELVERCDGLNPQIVHETCGLQLRLCCECIALACLAAHGSIPETGKKDLQKAYQPGAIMAALESLHPQFYPVPRIAERVEYGWHAATDDARASSFLSREALVILWNDLGSKLHKGSMKSMISGKTSLATEYPNLQDTLRPIEALLHYHTIHSRDLTHVFICEGLLDQPEAGVRCHLAVATAG